MCIRDRRFLDENYIRYSIRDGTLLGAVREQGFIRWDDDLDLTIHTDDWALFDRLVQSSGMQVRHIMWAAGAYLDPNRDRSQEYVVQLRETHLKSKVDVHADMVRANFEYYKPVSKRIGWVYAESLFTPPMRIYNINGVQCMGPNLKEADTFLTKEYGNWRQPTCSGGGLQDFNLISVVACLVMATGSVVRSTSNLKQSKMLLIAALTTCAVALYANWINQG